MSSRPTSLRSAAMDSANRAAVGGKHRGLGRGCAAKARGVHSPSHMQPCSRCSHAGKLRQASQDADADRSPH